MKIFLCMLFYLIHNYISCCKLINCLFSSELHFVVWRQHLWVHWILKSGRSCFWACKDQTLDLVEYKQVILLYAAFVWLISRKSLGDTLTQHSLPLFKPLSPTIIVSGNRGKLAEDKDNIINPKRIFEYHNRHHRCNLSFNSMKVHMYFKFLLWLPYHKRFHP